MNWQAIVIVGYLLVFFSICIPAGAVAWWCWSNRHGAEGTSPVLVRFAVVLWALAYDSISRLVAQAVFGYVGPKPVYSIGFQIVYWQGQVVLAVAITVLLAFLISAKRRSR